VQKLALGLRAGSFGRSIERIMILGARETHLQQLSDSFNREPPLNDTVAVPLQDLVFVCCDYQLSFFCLSHSQTRYHRRRTNTYLPSPSSSDEVQPLHNHQHFDGDVLEF
jgi:hypothetical protein